jgi:hypothetical protein
MRPASGAARGGSSVESPFPVTRIDAASAALARASDHLVMRLTHRELDARRTIAAKAGGDLRRLTSK